MLTCRYRCSHNLTHKHSLSPLVATQLAQSSPLLHILCGYILRCASLNRARGEASSGISAFVRGPRGYCESFSIRICLHKIMSKSNRLKTTLRQMLAICTQMLHISVQSLHSTLQYSRRCNSISVYAV